MIFVFWAPLAIALGVTWWVSWAETRRGHRFVQSFHGDRLPPAETLQGESLAFLVAVMPAYVDQARRSP